MTDSSPKISIQPENVSGDLIRLHLVGHNLPENFFGLSFHLRMEGVPARLSASGTDGSFDALLLASQKENDIIAGLSLMGGNALGVPDAELMTLDISPAGEGLLTASFERTVMSVIDWSSGTPARQDLNGVHWEGITMGVTPATPRNESTQQRLPFMRGGDESMYMQQDTTQIVSSWNASEIKSDVLSGDADSLTDAYSFLFASLVVLILLFLFALVFKKMRS